MKKFAKFWTNVIVSIVYQLLTELDKFDKLTKLTVSFSKSWFGFAKCLTSFCSWKE